MGKWENKIASEKECVNVSYTTKEACELLGYGNLCNGFQFKSVDDFFEARCHNTYFANSKNFPPGVFCAFLHEKTHGIEVRYYKSEVHRAITFNSEKYGNNTKNHGK